MRRLVTLIFFSLCIQQVCAQSIIPNCDQVKQDTTGQRDLIDVAKSIFNVRPKKNWEPQDRKVYFSFIPSGASAPGGSGRALVTSTTAAAYLGPHKTTNISSVTFTPYFNFKGRFGLPLRSSIWFPNNKWTVQGDIRLMVYPQYTWGLGSTNGTNDRVLIDYRYIRFYQEVLKRIEPYLYAGVGYELDYRSNVKSDDPNVDLKTFTKYAYGLDQNTLSSGLSLNLIYDSRNNSINPLPGAYANIKYRCNPTFMGSSYNWHSVYIDVRKYVALNACQTQQQNTIAFWSYFWSALNKSTPYLDLPSTGWDPYNRSARGIDQNRYRGRTLLYLESEYRRSITRNGLFGFVLFANVNTVSGSGTFFQSWHPAAGGGLRFKFNKGSSTNLCIDYGFSKGYQGIKLALGETF